MSFTGRNNMRLGGFAIIDVQGVEEMIVDRDDEGFLAQGPGPSASTPVVGLHQQQQQQIANEMQLPRGMQQSAVREEQGQDLPSRQQFMDPDNAQGLLALSDPRTDAHTDDDCGICNSNMRDLDEAVVIVRCGHIYHRSCLLPWFDIDVRVHTCPYCRKDLFTAPIQPTHVTTVPTIPRRPTSVIAAWRILINVQRNYWRQNIQRYVEARDQRTYYNEDLLRRLGFTENRMSLSDAEILLRIEDEISRLNERLERIDEQESRLQLEDEEAQ
ncbi:hypothetical protein P171DRAFT_438689 [Karstenula rhodostoma CBS 690.94]|uniref:RING-type domain-containing protein n=1 Tax=Karstenula rhodostoma CBS 690.94 TaxID=1392251 RepID=A0A9P4UIT1_9PLEO|nr:hypothetical protein P171DRAFT_438689 [Karstenula rhodostoma CBS 690.94]